VHDLFRRGVTKSEIVRRLGVSRPTVIAWLEQKEYTDGRGWQEGTKRSHTNLEEERIVALKKKRIDEKKFFLGTPYVQMDYAKEFPTDSVPSRWFVDDVVARQGLQTHEPKKRKKGQNIVSRQLFPIRSIISLGKIHQSSDFIGKKFLTGRKEPISIFSTSYYQWFELYQIWRVSGETSQSAISCLKGLWSSTPLPHVMRMDNGSTFRGNVVLDGHIGTFLKFLLNIGVTPLFSAQYKSYTNPHVEGHNRTFTEKLWQKHHFTSEEEIDQACTRFNRESREFYDYRFKERLTKKGLRFLLPTTDIVTNILRSPKGKKIYFIRFVERWKETSDESGIVILNRFVRIIDPYLNQFVFVTLNLETGTLHVFSEHDGIATEILCEPFSYTV
jgi:transposase